jgi:hypothetical protein
VIQRYTAMPEPDSEMPVIVYNSDESFTDICSVFLSDYNHNIRETIWRNTCCTCIWLKGKKLPNGTSNFSKGYWTLQFLIRFLFIDKWREEIRASFKKFCTLYVFSRKMNLFYKIHLQAFNVISIVLYHSGPTFGQVFYSCLNAFVLMCLITQVTSLDTSSMLLKRLGTSQSLVGW